jgi:amino acid adenylation domain-containing protein
MSDGKALPGNAIAVVGMALRVPGAQTLEDFWQNLRTGVESISSFTHDELLAAGVSAEELAQPGYVRSLGALDDVAGFDAQLFGFAPREAQLLDPQHRVLLECAWEGLEHAGHMSDLGDATVAFYGGVGESSYYLQNVLPNRNVVARVGAMPTRIANDKDFVSTRVSYKLNLNGPSMTVQTACSTSLVAVHLACQALIDDECDLALAGGARILLPHKRGYRFDQDGILSPDGHCRAFDASAAGTVPGSGAGVVVLKRLGDAIADRDVIHAVIRGSAINNDGARKVGFTAPSVEGQADVIAEALGVADVDPATVTYVETHGTGTVLGDTIELAVLNSVFSGTGRAGRCAIGSVKTNLGHLDVAAGVIGMIKAVLALRARELPPSLHFSSPHPQLGMEDAAFYVNTELAPWRADVLRAGVSSFGIGGTNAHVVLEEAPRRVTRSAGLRPQVLPLSAASRTALDAVSARLAAHLHAHPDENLADVAYTLQRGRRTLQHRRFIVGRSVAEAIDALGQPALDHHATNEKARDRDVVFLFPGQGTQRIDIGKALYSHEPVFRAEIDRAAELTEDGLDIGIRRLLYPAEDESDAAHERINQTRYAQPALFAVEYALAKLWMSWGVRPVAMLGHSVGELVAACLSGVLAFEDALDMVVARGRLMQSAPPGSMLAVAQPMAELTALLGDSGLDLAAVNAPRQCVVSGPADLVAAMEARLAERGVETRKLVTSHAFHSRQMEAAAAALETQIARVRLAAPRIPFVSNVTGTWITDAEATSPAYWARQLRSTVQFAVGLRTVGASGGVLLEVGPGDVLTSLVRACGGGQGAVASLPSVADSGHDAHTDLLTAAGELWRQGVRVEWERLHGESAPRRVVLPTYPFEHRRYWIDRPRGPVAAQGGVAAQVGAEGVMVRGFRRVGPAAPGGTADGTWLVIPDPAGVLDELANRLGDSPARAVRAEADPGKLLASVATADERVAGVVYGELLGADGDRDPVPWLLWLERAMEARGDGHARVVAVVTGALDVTGAEALAPPKAALIAWAEDRPGTRALLDVTGPLTARHLAAELHSRSDGPVVALRAGHRFVPSLEPLHTGRLVGAGRHAGARYALTGDAAAASEFGEALSRAGATVCALSEQGTAAPRLAVVVVDAGQAATSVLDTLAHAASAVSTTAVSACEVHVLAGDMADAGLARVVEAQVSAIARESQVAWATCSWPSGDRAAIARHAPRTVGLATGSCQVVLTSLDDDAEEITGELPEGSGMPRYDEIEATVATIFGDLLGVASVAPTASFFELGGDSLLAVKLLADLRAACGIAPPMRAVVAEPTIRGIASAVRTTRAQAGDATPEILPTVVPDPEHADVPFPLTELQQAFWVGRAGVFQIGDVGMHLYQEFDTPDLDVPRLECALRQLIRRHGMLRMIVLPHGEQQILTEVPDYVIVTEDVRDLPEHEANAAVERTRAQMSHQVFAPDRWPLFDIRATVMTGGRTRLHFSVDGLVTDAWATRILKRDLTRLYHNPDLELPELELSFRDYLLAERSIESTQLYRNAERYWLERIPTMALAPELPLARDPGTIGAARFRKVAGRLPGESWTRLKAWAARRNITPTAALIAAYSEAIATWSKDRRFTLNLPTANRLPLHSQVGEIIGDFTSVTLLEIDAEQGVSFEARARAVRDQLASDLDHRLFSGVRVQREMRKARGDTAAVMPVIFTCVLYDEQDPQLGEVVYSISQTPQIWMDAQAYEVDGGLALDIDSVEGLFPEGMVAAIHAASLALLTWLAADEAHWSRPMPSLVPETDLAAREEYNRTEGPVPSGLLHTPFFAMAARMPERPAVITPDRTVSYGELAARARGIAARLGGLGVRRNELVAVAMEKGWEQPAAVLGVLAAGAAYLPVDPDLPDERIRFLLEHGQVSVVLTQAGVAEAGPDRFGGERSVLVVDELPADVAGGGEVDRSTAQDDLAYVIFTSGSTGVPKGVMISHGSALNTIVDVNEQFGVGADDRVLALSSLSFDLSVYDIFGPLAVGGAIVMPAKSAHRDPAVWHELMTTAGVTIWNSVPALMELLVDHLSVIQPAGTRLRQVMMSGDWIPVGLPDRIRRLLGTPEITSLGGATEASIWSILYPVGEVSPEWTSIPYGRPMRNQTFHVLDDALRPRPAWVPGQLYIGGAGLAKGYLRDEARTSASFILHPQTGERLYRTGDLGRFLPSGHIEFLGREDFQVKIQGNRIELGEIEAAISQHPDVRTAVVVVHGQRHGSKRLVAFVARRTGHGVPDDLNEFLAAKLPRYMVPAAYQELDAVPLTANGKVDRQALVVAGGAVADEATAYVAPRTPVEGVVADVWTSLLGGARVGVHDNFFALGGDSLMAMRAVVHLRKALEIEVPMQVIFDSQTLADVAVVVEDLVLTEIENMSDEEAQLFLSGESAQLGSP